MVFRIPKDRRDSIPPHVIATKQAWCGMVFRIPKDRRDSIPPHVIATKQTWCGMVFRIPKDRRDWNPAPRYCYEASVVRNGIPHTQRSAGLESRPTLLLPSKRGAEWYSAYPKIGGIPSRPMLLLRSKRGAEWYSAYPNIGGIPSRPTLLLRSKRGAEWYSVCPKIGGIPSRPTMMLLTLTHHRDFYPMNRPMASRTGVSRLMSTFCPMAGMSAGTLS